MRDPHVELTQEEQRQLRAIEEALTRSDPRFARRVRKARRLPFVGVVVFGSRVPPMATGIVLLALGVVATLVAFPFSTTAAAIGYVAMLAGALYVSSSTSLQRAGESISARLRARTRHED
jgi:hypothetical protein